MNTIIAATDFSDFGNNAAFYAAAFATSSDTKLLVLHSFMMPITFSDTPMPVMPIEEGRSIAEENMKELCSKLGLAWPGLQIEGEVCLGDIVECIREYDTPLLVFMGNKNEQALPSWMGNSLVHAMKSLGVPVIGIPGGHAFKPISNICLACDEKHVLEDLPADRLLQIVKMTGAQLHVLSVDKSETALPEQERHERMHVLHEALSPADPQYYYEYNSDLGTALSSFAERQHIDWLIITPHKYPILEGLFHKSNTREITKHLHIPILALHKAA